MGILHFPSRLLGNIAHYRHGHIQHFSALKGMSFFSSEGLLYINYFSVMHSDALFKSRRRLDLSIYHMFEFKK